MMDRVLGGLALPSRESEWNLPMGVRISYRDDA